MLDEFTARNSGAMRNMKERYGIEPQPLPQEVMSEFKRLARQYYEELSASNLEFARVYESYSGFLEEVQAWHLVSEEAYYNARR